MTKKTLSIEALSYDSLKKLVEVGDNIKTARVRRGLKQSDIASRMLVTPKTYRKIESGDPSVSIGLYFHALIVLNLDNDILKVADPKNDSIGIMMEKRNMPKKVRDKLDKELEF